MYTFIFGLIKFIYSLMPQKWSDLFDNNCNSNILKLVYLLLLLLQNYLSFCYLDFQTIQELLKKKSIIFFDVPVHFRGFLYSISLGLIKHMYESFSSAALRLLFGFILLWYRFLSSLFIYFLGCSCRCELCDCTRRDLSSFWWQV